uniref:Uncharacterized protein n=1 Tax=Arundo donax TaxID=35708 RepID=A0A0A9EMT9_ARUDO
MKEVIILVPKAMVWDRHRGTIKLRVASLCGGQKIPCTM